MQKSTFVSWYAFIFIHIHWYEIQKAQTFVEKAVCLWGWNESWNNTEESILFIKSNLGKGFWVLMVCKIIIKTDTHMTSFLFPIVISTTSMQCSFCNTVNTKQLRDLWKKELAQQHTLDEFDRDPSTLLVCTVCCMLVFVSIKREMFSCGSGLPWNFHKLPESWAPGSAGWRACLSVSLKLVYCCTLERLCINSFQMTVWMSCLTTQFCWVILVY